MVAQYDQDGTGEIEFEEFVQMLMSNRQFAALKQQLKQARAASWRRAADRHSPTRQPSERPGGDVDAPLLRVPPANAYIPDDFSLVRPPGDAAGAGAAALSEPPTLELYNLETKRAEGKKRTITLCGKMDVRLAMEDAMRTASGVDRVQGVSKTHMLILSVSNPDVPNLDRARAGRSDAGP